jgi:hypothetical protein
VFTKPVVHLLQPRLARTFYWRVQENDLVLYPDFVYNRLQGHTPFQELIYVHERRRDQIWKRRLPSLRVACLLDAYSEPGHAVIRRHPRSGQTQRTISERRASVVGEEFLRSSYLAQQPSDPGWHSLQG